MNPFKSAKMWGRLLAEAVAQKAPPPPEILAGFARDYRVMAEHADLHLEAVAVMLEERAISRGGESIRAQLRAAAHDVRQGLHMQEEPPIVELYRHADGDVYLYLGECVMKDDHTEEWVDAVSYRATDGPRAELLCVTSRQRWDERFELLTDGQ